ncbi:MAG: zinc-ribbon domain-containing protein [Sphingomonadales bacterium]
MIISCPQCSAQYRVAVGVVARRPRLKCAACGHRWVPREELDEDEAVAAVQEEARAASVAPPPAPAPEPAPEPEPLPEPPRPPSPWLKNLVAIVLGAAFATAAAGLWVGRIDPETLPGAADLVARIAPSSPLLDVKVEGRVTRLPDGNALLEVTGTIRNPGRTAASVPPLNARLMIAGRPARDWTIPPPAEMVGAGKTLAFASTLTDVPPGGPVTVQVRLGR